MNPESPQASSSPEVRLLPLVEHGSNEALANTLARLLVDDESQAEMGARAALTILTGIQAFYDSGGDYRVIALAWEPVIVARQMEKIHGANGWREAAMRAGAAKAAEDHDIAALYERVARLLKSDIKIEVDSPA